MALDDESDSLKPQKPIQRKIPLRSKSRLKSSKKLTSKSQMKRSKINPVSKKKKIEREEWKNIRVDALDRDGRICQAQLDQCKQIAVDVHHILPRSHGGKNNLENLISACRSCHAWIHAHPQLAKSYGLIEDHYE